MYNNICFPGLNLNFNINSIALEIGPFTIYWYGLIVVTGMFLASVFIYKKAKIFDLNPDKMIDYIIYSVISGIIGARLYYVIFSWDYYKNHLNEIYKIWEGGIGYYGSIIAAVLVIFLILRKDLSKFIRVCDLIMSSLLLGQGIGRWGNFVNVEAFGGYYTGIFRMTSPEIDNYFHIYPEKLTNFSTLEVINMDTIPVHPTFFYESIWLLLGFSLIYLYINKRKFNGELSLIYLMWNGFGRFFIEGLRTDSLMLFNIKISQIIALLTFIFSLIIYIYLLKKFKENTLPNIFCINSNNNEENKANENTNLEDVDTNKE